MRFINILEEEDIHETHYTEKDVHRRMVRWKANNFSEDGSPVKILVKQILEDFYKDFKIPLIKIDLDSKIAKSPIRSMKIFIEKNGKFFNYSSHEQTTEKARLEQEEQNILKQKEDLTKLEAERSEREKVDLLVQEEEIRLKMEKLRREEREILEEKSKSLRYKLFLFLEIILEKM